MNFVRVTAPLLASLAAIAVQAQPAANNEETARLRAELDALRERLDELEDTNSPGRSVDISGDIRYRHETINDDAAPERSRHRVRARLQLDSRLSDDLEVGIRLATGASNPVSANSTLDGGFSRKDIGFDRVYFSWDATDTLELRGGKMSNPMFRPGGNQLIFDNDLNPEGLALRYSDSQIFANVAGLWVDERSADDDAILIAVQGGFSGTVGEDTDLVVGIGYYDYRKTRGYQPFFNGSPAGNSVDLAGNLVNDYDLTQVFAQLGFEAGGHPLQVFADYVENTGADNLETGFSVGARWRRASAPGSWDVTWQYADVEADAVVATFSDSNFGGGGTDGKGHIFRASYYLRDNVRLNSSYFLNERGEAAGNERDYDRLQLDVSFLF